MQINKPYSDDSPRAVPRGGPESDHLGLVGCRHLAAAKPDIGPQPGEQPVVVGWDKLNDASQGKAGTEI